MTDTQIAIFGEALFDRFADGRQILGGAPFNVAWHLQAFAQRPSFISRVGEDAAGDDIRQAMSAWGMSVENLQTDSDYPTGTVQVIINDGEPRYEILADQAYDFIKARQLNADSRYSVIYHGTLALRNSISEQAWDDLSGRHRGKIFIDVNLRSPWWYKDKIERRLGKADWIKLNHDELMQLAPRQMPLQDAMRWFWTQYEPEVLVVTCGSQGAAAINQTGDVITVAPTAALTVVDTVGAGDAFAAVLLLGMQHGWRLQPTMERAQLFASALVSQRGATVQDLSFYRPFISAWDLD